MAKRKSSKAAAKKSASKRVSKAKKTASKTTTTASKKTVARKPVAKKKAATPKKTAAKKRTVVAKKRTVAAKNTKKRSVAAKKSANLAPKAARAAAIREKASPRTSAGNIERETTRHSEPTSDRPSIPSSLTVDQSRKARTRREELNQRVKAHPETGPAMTAGDVDADWEQAYSSGDEAPGGDNPTPDQDVVDEIGHALGVEYQDGEELKGADKISDRDRHRWELDPASAEDYPEHET